MFRRGRISLKDKMRQGLAVQRAYAAALPDDDPRRASNEARLNAQAAAIPPKRHLIRRPVDGKPVQRLEKHVLADVLEALRKDPRVAQVDREQSGLFQDGNRFITVGSRGRPDVSGMLVGGRHFEIEVKRPGQKPDERQQRRLDHIKKNGGISGYATSAEEALALLP